MLAGAVKAAAAAAKASKSSSGGSSSSSSSGSSGSSGSSSSGSSGASMAATGKGGSYSIGSDKGKNFVNSAAAGSTMKGSDGSTWTKNSDGTTTISKGGQTFTYGGASGTGGSGGGSSSGGTYTPLGTYNDQTIKDTSVEDSAQMAAIKKRYAEAQARGDTAAMKSAHADAEALRAQYGYSGGSDGSDYIGKGYVSGNVLGKQMSNQLNSGFDAYKKYMEDAAAQQQAALKAKVDSAVASLNGQKYDVMKQTEANNAAAEKAYMQSIKPGGSNAETLAANGLLTSGLPESSDTLSCPTERVHRRPPAASNTPQGRAPSAHPRPGTGHCTPCRTLPSCSASPALPYPCGPLRRAAMPEQLRPD